MQIKKTETEVKTEAKNEVEYINLAYPTKDGENILIPRLGTNKVYSVNSALVHETSTLEWVKYINSLKD